MIDKIILKRSLLLKLVPAFFVFVLFSVESFALDPNLIRFNRSVDFIGDVSQKFIEPKSIFVDMDGEEFFIADNMRSEILVFSLEGDFILKIGKSSGIEFPIEVATFGPNLLVVEEGKNFVTVLNFFGKKVGEIKPPQHIVSNFSPSDIFVTNKNEIFITDIVSKTCFVFDDQLKYVRTIGAGFQSLADVSVYKDKVYFLDTSGSRSVHVYDKSGAFITSFESFQGRGGTLNQPISLNVDPFGRVWIVDILSGIHVYDEKYNKIALLGKNKSKQNSYLYYPIDIDFGPENSVYIIDRGDKKLKIFKYIK